MQDVTGLAGWVNTRITLPQSTVTDIAAPSVALNGPGLSGAGNPVEFSKVLEGAIDKVSGMQEAVSAMQTQVELGVSDDLVGTMIASQKASLAFQGMIQARNRIVSAYETVFSRPV